MPTDAMLGERLEKTVRNLVESGRYGSRREVLREGVRLLEEREKALAALDALLEPALADEEAGRMFEADQVFSELRARYAPRPEDVADT